VIAVGAAGIAVLGFAPSAQAANSDTITVAGGSAYTYTFNQSPSIAATAHPNCLGTPKTAVTISISGPGVTSPILVSHARDCIHPLTLSPSSDSVNTAHPLWTGGSPAMNGTYSLTLNNEGRTQTASFTLLIPPARTRGFAVNSSGTTATFDWIANSEPDITGYDITGPSGQTLTSAPASSCSGSDCSSGPVNLGKSVVGHTEKFAIVAQRSCGDASCSGGHVNSSAATASAAFTAPPSTPTPTPSTSPSTSPSDGPGGGGHNGGGSGGGVTLGGGGSGGGGNNGVVLGKPNKHHHHGALPAISGEIAPVLGAPDLPGILSSTKPLSLGKPGGKIAYPAPEIAKKKVSTVHSISRDISAGLSAKPLWRGIAAAAVLLLIAVHLRSWAGRETY
jgi:uncharacterized membrane protein YgcG